MNFIFFHAFLYHLGAKWEQKIEVDEYFGNDIPDDYIALLHLSFDVKLQKK